MNGHINGYTFLMSSKYVIKVFGCEIYFTEDVLLIEVPEIVQQLSQMLSERQSVVMKLILCDKVEVVEKYNYSKFVEWSQKEKELRDMKSELEKAGLCWCLNMNAAFAINLTRNGLMRWNEVSKQL